MNALSESFLLLPVPKLIDIALQPNVRTLFVFNYQEHKRAAVWRRR